MYHKQSELLQAKLLEASGWISLPRQSLYKTKRQGTHTGLLLAVRDRKSGL